MLIGVIYVTAETTIDIYNFNNLSDLSGADE